MQERSTAQPGYTTRAGHVALVGRPNTGKSTLLNALVGEKLSIVTPRAQTTRERVFGILTTRAAQVVFVDTPGLLEPKYKLQQSMLDTALAALGDADVALLLLDGTQSEELPAAEVIVELRRKKQGLVCAINKTDQAQARQVARLAEWSLRELSIPAHLCSALTGAGLADLQEAIIERLPESPFLYDPEDLALQPMRFFVEELVRETIFERFEQEIPYSTVVRIEEYKEDRDPLYIRATIYVDRDSQKSILLGKGGVAIRELGRSARSKIEAFVDRSVYLDLWVKAMPGWRNKPSALKFLGYSVRDEDTPG
jgi:GTPase